MAKKVKIKPDKGPFVAGASLGYGVYHKDRTIFQRAQLAIYMENKGFRGEMDLPEEFKDGSTGYKQFHYTPQQKRGGKIPKEVLNV